MGAESSVQMTSRSEDTFFHLLVHRCLVIHLREAYPSRGARYEGRDLVACAASLSAVSGSLPPGVNLRSTEDSSAPLEHLEPCLLDGCEPFGPNDLQTFGPGPVDVGGFAEIWLCGKRVGTKVMIKSYRRYTSSSHLPAFLVSSSSIFSHSDFLRGFSADFRRRPSYPVI